MAFLFSNVLGYQLQFIVQVFFVLLVSFVVCYTTVFSVVTQRSSPQTCINTFSTNKIVYPF